MAFAVSCITCVVLVQSSARHFPYPRGTNRRPMERKLTTRSDRATVPDSRRTIENSDDGLAPSVRFWCLSKGGGTHDPCSAERARAACAAGIQKTQADSHHVVGGHAYA
jgi:hypothetical protein